ncbi:hypothetical protein ACWEPC_29010 [Nonomuraea sp. NPDC004297]
MAQGQVSVWVPLVVAVLGILGLVIGQLVNAWREDRRWQRELVREDVRWQREQERELARHVRETEAHWREERLAAYAHFAEIMDTWRDLLVSAIEQQLAGESAAEEEFAKMEALTQRATASLTKILLVGSSDMQAQCHELFALYGSSYWVLKDGKRVLPMNAHPDDAVSNAYFQMISDFRVELGTGPLDGYELEPGRDG